jgi:hypothetical protein
MEIFSRIITELFRTFKSHSSEHLFQIVSEKEGNISQLGASLSDSQRGRGKHLGASLSDSQCGRRKQLGASLSDSQRGRGKHLGARSISFR